MRTTKVTIDGKDYQMCTSLGAQIALQEKGISVLDTGVNKPKEYITMIHEFLTAGYKWSKKMGEEANEPPTLDELIGTLDVADLLAINVQLREIMIGVRNVEAKPSKK